MREPTALRAGRARAKGLGRGSLKNARSRKSIFQRARRTPFSFGTACVSTDRRGTFMW